MEPPKFIYETLPHNGSVLGGPLGIRTGRGPKRDQGFPKSQKSLLLSGLHRVRIQREVSSLQRGTGLSPEPGQAETLLSGTVRNKFLWLLNHPIYGTLL